MFFKVCDIFVFSSLKAWSKDTIVALWPQQLHGHFAELYDKQQKDFETLKLLEPDMSSYLFSIEHSA